MADLAAAIYADIDAKAALVKGLDPDPAVEYAADGLHDALEFVVRLHLRYERDGRERCGHCKHTWPCPTVSAIVEHLPVVVDE